MSNLGQHLKFSNGKTSPDRTDTGFYPVYGANGIIGYSSEYNSDENTIILEELAHIVEVYIFQIRNVG